MDLIDRQAAIDILEERLHANGYSNVALVSELNRSIGYLMQLPSAQRWIPAAEQLPVPRTPVLVSYSKGVTIAQMDGYVTTPLHTEHYWRGMNGPKHTLRSVTAWMPLPEPYREDGDGDV